MEATVEPSHELPKGYLIAKGKKGNSQFCGLSEPRGFVDLKKKKEVPLQPMHIVAWETKSVLLSTTRAMLIFFGLL